MRVDRVLVLDVQVTLSAVRVRLAGLARELPVVVAVGADYYVFDVATLRDAASAAAASTARLAELLDVSGWTPATVVDADDADTAAPGWVVLDGPRVVGLTVAGGGSGRGDERFTVDAPPTEVAPGANAAPPTDSLDIPSGMGPGPGPGGADVNPAPAAPDAPDVGMFRAYPDVAAPAQADVGATITVTAGFSLTRPDNYAPQGPPVLVMNAAQQLTFVIQIAGFGFTFPDGISRSLTVDRDTPAGVVTFGVLADAVTAPTSRVLELSYELGGAVVGRAWAQVDVVPAAIAATAEKAATGGTGLELAAGSAAPYLGVDIHSKQADSQLEWIFHTPVPGVARPEQQVLRDLPEHSAESFATTIMGKLPGETGSPLLPQSLRGIGMTVADQLPPEFWQLLESTWAAAIAAGETPTMLITTDEPFIPWELAWVDSERIDLPAGVTENHLGSLWSVGRWIPPAPGRRGERPPAPPPVRAGGTMAVLVGHYVDNPLAGAEQEGADFAATYGAVPVDATEAQVAQFLDDALVVDGTPVRPTLIHIAGHGEVDQDNAQFTGVLLDNGRHLDPLTLRASRLVRATEPFLFVNACQVGAASRLLNDFGGLAGSFVLVGACGVVAPLWNIDDDVARSIAVDFYARTIKDGMPVGEAMRVLRNGFTGSTATPLAYVFYGNPALTLSLTTTEKVA